MHFVEIIKVKQKSCLGFCFFCLVILFHRLLNFKEVHLVMTCFFPGRHLNIQS